MKSACKRALRCFLLEKLREVTRLQLSELAAAHDCQPFEMADQFEIDIERVEKLFLLPALR